MSESTITVAGFFGDKQVTRDQFIKIWLDHVNEARKLDYSDQWQARVNRFVSEVEAQASLEFDKLLEAQTRRANRAS